jgi:hypothetical protein
MLMGAPKTKRMASVLTFFFRAIPQRWQWMSQSHRTSSMWGHLGFLCECWNQSAKQWMHTYTKQAEKVDSKGF